MKVSESIEVHIDHDGQSRLVGRCRYITKSHGSSSVFEYDDAWLKFSKAFALDPANLLLGNNPVFLGSDRSALPGAIRDGAPDRWGRQLIRRAFSKSKAKHALSEIDFLLGINDQSRIGALRFRREGESNFDENIDHIPVPTLNRLPALLEAADAVLNEMETSDQLNLLLSEGSPLGGAQPKSAILDKSGTPAIAKFPRPDDERSIPHGEVLALTLAKRAGLSASSSRLEVAAGRPVALILRFDRRDNRSIPFLSANTLLSELNIDQATYVDIAESIRMFSSAPTEDLHELWRRIVFNVMIGNLDDHLRNHGFLYDGDGKWRLSPAYDLNPVPLEEKLRELTTWISDEGPDANIDQAIQVAPHFALKRDHAIRLVDTVSKGIKDWRDVARRIGMSTADTKIYATAITTA